MQKDDEERFSRYADVIGEGRFKQVYRAFDEDSGQDVAWAIISAEQQGLDAATMAQLLGETQRNTQLRHKNIIRCYKCWASPGMQQINLITELFTSGNLRDFIQEHQPLGADALRKFTRQVLEGIEYLHSQKPAVVHGDLRCDKIYVNGNQGTVKIGDLGLVTLLARNSAQWEPGSAYMSISQHTESAKREPAYDVWACGMCLLEVYTQRIIEPAASHNLEELVATVTDDWPRELLAACFRSPDRRPTASALLERFFAAGRPKPSPSRATTPPPAPAGSDAPPRGGAGADVTSHAAMCQLSEQLQSQSDAAAAGGSGSGAAGNGGGAPNGAAAPPPPSAPSSSGGGAGAAAGEPLPRVKTCQLRGEDYVFTVRQSNRINLPSIAYIQLTMTTADDETGRRRVFAHDRIRAQRE